MHEKMGKITHRLTNICCPAMVTHLNEGSKFKYIRDSSVTSLSGGVYHLRK